MQIENLGANKTVIHTSQAAVLYSYSTPVAAYILGQGYVRTNRFWSVTTSKHINSWLKDKIGTRNIQVESVDQSVLDELVN